MMINKRDILDSVRTSDERLFLSKVLDQAILCLKYHETRFTDFLDPYQQKLLERQWKKCQQVNMHCWGGYEAAERNMVSFFPDYRQWDDIDYPIAALEITGSDMDELNHRDFLGSILGLGIKREKIGDILINKDFCYVFCIADIKDFIGMNLAKIANKNVCVTEKRFEEIRIPEKKFKAINTTVASLRLDAILSAVLGEARNKTAAYIKAEKVNVNWEPSKSASQLLKEGDVLSIRGKGRIILDHIGGNTRKGRISICIKKYI